MKRDELDTFRHFAEVCPILRGRLNTVEQPHSDPPDILCEFKSGERLAFELVSCEDEIGKDKKGNGIAWTQGINDQPELKELLNTEYRSAVADGRVNQPERFESSTVRVEFEAGVSLQKRKNAVPRVIKLLNQLGRGQHFTPNAKTIRSIWCMPWQTKVASCSEPSFSVDSATLYVGNSTVERVQSKIKSSEEVGSKYAKIDCPMQLLAWSRTACHAELDFWESKLVNLLSSNGMGKFERAWVFGLGENSIIFDSADIGL